MNKHSISVTLGAENLLWLHGQARATGVRSISAALDRLVAEARTGVRVHESTIRSVAGTISLGESDPDLLAADAAIRGLLPGFEATKEPRVAEAPGRYGQGRRKASAPPPDTCPCR